MFMEYESKIKLQEYAAVQSFTLTLSEITFEILQTWGCGPVSLELMFCSVCEMQDQFISQWEDMLSIKKAIFHLSYFSLYKWGYSQEEMNRRTDTRHI
jgi:hypothetical protein